MIELAHLTLVKTVTNDSGGTASGDGLCAERGRPDADLRPSGANADVNAGSYPLSETTLPGYTAGAWSCVGGTFTGRTGSRWRSSRPPAINNNDNGARRWSRR